MTIRRIALLLLFLFSGFLSPFVPDSAFARGSQVTESPFRFDGARSASIPRRSLPSFEGVRAPEPYEGDLKEKDLDVEGIKKALALGQSAPERVRLRYSGISGVVYLSFYDLRGREILYRFREDKFDTPGERWLSRLTEGGAYEVKGSFEGLLFRDTLIPPGDPKFASVAALKDSIPLYTILDLYPLRMEQIIF